MHVSHDEASAGAILGRIIDPGRPTLDRRAASAILALDFADADKECMRQLSAKARAGTLTSAEEVAIDNYERVGHLLNLLQSKARLSLKGRGLTNGKARSR